MTRTILFLILLATLAMPASLTAEPTPSAEKPSRKNTKKTNVDKPATTNAPVSGEGWNYVKGEWIHPDGYKYVKGQMFRIGAQTHKSPPKPPSKALLDSVKAKPTPTPDPNSAAAKAAEKERNLRPRPASQTGTHL
jgi:hypothetical protein